jgi:D-xylose transport system permease protein
MSTTTTAIAGSAAPAPAPTKLTGKARILELLATDLRAVPVVAGLLVLVIYFASQSEFFLSSRNISNLLVQTVVTGTIALGIVFVLLLGEIDLSVAAISGLCAVVMARLVVSLGWSNVVAVLVAIAMGVLLGALTGFWSTRFLVPSFVVTLGAGLMLNGTQLMTLPNSGRYSLVNTGIDDIAGSNLTGVPAWSTVAVAAVFVFGLRFTAHRRNTQFGISTSLLRSVLLPTGITAVAGIIVVAVLTANQGVPLPVLIFGVLLGGATYLLTETRFGLHLYAVGGNPEAARRSGINVTRVKVLAFAISGGLAALAGVIAASRILGVSVSSGGGIGGGALLLNAIAAAVIGGVSLFGGRGRASAALLGALVIGTVGNGLNLLDVSTDVQLLVTGGLLVLAVTVDRSIERLTTTAGR